MEDKVSLRLLVILLAFFLILSITAAVPWSRSLKALTAAQSAQYLQHQMAQGGLVEEEESFLEGRMDLEIRAGFWSKGHVGGSEPDLDYSGPGANNHHDPNPPGSD